MVLRKNAKLRGGNFLQGTDALVLEKNIAYEDKNGKLPM